MKEIIVTTQPELKAIIEQILREVINPRPQPILSDDGLYSAQEAAKYLKLPKTTLYQLTHRRELSFSKSGRDLIFFKDDLDTYLKANRKASRKEILHNLNTQQ
jgi:excisionase family DNA binding protein